MAIDVQAEAKGIAEAYQPSVVDPTMLAADITSLVTRAVAESLTRIGDLLCVIHRDGGHYISEHGLDKALQDAADAYYARLRETDHTARREQMEWDCKAVCHLCGRPEWTSPDSGGFHHSITFHQVVTCPGHAIRSAFAATEPQKGGNEIIEETLADGWPKNQQIPEQCIAARKRFDKAAVRVAKLNEAQMLGLADSHKDRRRGLVHVVLIAAEELGLDGAA